MDKEKKKARKQARKEGYEARMQDQPRESCPYPDYWTGGIGDAWCFGWWKAEYAMEESGPLYDPEVVAEYQRRQARINEPQEKQWYILKDAEGDGWTAYEIEARFLPYIKPESRITGPFDSAADAEAWAGLHGDEPWIGLGEGLEA